MYESCRISTVIIITVEHKLNLLLHSCEQQF